jgi:hypothetical protein
MRGQIIDRIINLSTMKWLGHERHLGVENCVTILLGRPEKGNHLLELDAD